MYFLNWIGRNKAIYWGFSALITMLVLLFVAQRIEADITDARETPLAQALGIYTSTLESGTVNSRAMGSAILLGLANGAARQLALGKLPPDAPEVLSVLDSMRTLYGTESVFLVDGRGMVAASSCDDSQHPIGDDMSFRPYVQMALQGSANVYPAVGIPDNKRGIYLAAPMHSVMSRKSETIGAIVVKIPSEKLDVLLKSWKGGPSMLVSPDGLVFSSSREDWLFALAGGVSKNQLDRMRQSRQFGNLPESAAQVLLPFALTAREANIDGVRYMVRSNSLDWDDPAGEWKLLLLDRNDPWWMRGEVIAQAFFAAFIAAMALFWVYTLARNAGLREKRLREQAIAAVTFESKDGVIITDADCKIIKVNQSFTRITGYSSEEAVGRTPSFLQSGRHDAEFFSQMWDAIRRDKCWSGELWSKRKCGEIYPEQLTVTSIAGAGGKVINYVGIFFDITRRKITEAEIHNLAFYDTLTQLPNRRLLHERLGHALTTSKRDGRYGALMFLDMDNFKQLNDTHGHAMGDLLLIEVARRIASCVREVDTVARFGGDEFVVMLAELAADKETSREQAGCIAEKIRATLAEPYELTVANEQNGLAVHHRCTSSIGVVLFVGNLAGADEILKWADVAMYRAKEDGRNMIHFYSPED